MTEHIDLNQNNISGTVLDENGTAKSGVPILVRYRAEREGVVAPVELEI